MMELSKPLQEEILKIQNDLKTAIQNHQIIVLRQKSNPLDLEIKKQLGEVQKHIRSLGETQKILVARVRNELAAKKSLRVNNNNNHSPKNDYSRLKKTNHIDRSLLKPNTDISNRSLLKHKPADKDKLLDPQKNGEYNNDNSVYKSNNEQHNKDRSLLKQNIDYGRSLLKAKSENHYLPNKVKDDTIVQDSSSEENKTPCPSPRNHFNASPRKTSGKHETNQDVESSWDLEETIPAKRSKATLQATPRPSSPAQPYKSRKTSDSGNNSSEDSVDNPYSSQFPDNSKEKFMISLGLMDNEKLLKHQNEKSERRRRRRKCSEQHHWYSSLWDLTVLQKRNHEKYTSEPHLSPIGEIKAEDSDDLNKAEDSQDSTGSINNIPRICYICRKNSDIPLIDCSTCPTAFHASCNTNSLPGVCSTCCHVGGNVELGSSNSLSSADIAARYIKKTESTYTERLKEKHHLLRKNASLKEELSRLEEKAKDLSESLVSRVTTVNQLTANEEKVRNSIKKVIDFVTAMQKPELPESLADS